MLTVTYYTDIKMCTEPRLFNQHATMIIMVTDYTDMYVHKTEII